jgi:hypothetical protein
MHCVIGHEEVVNDEKDLSDDASIDLVMMMTMMMM